jgi:hypothetical protein
MESHGFYHYLNELGYLYFGAGYLGTPPLGGGIQAGCSLWRYAKGKWVLEKDDCGPGRESSPPQEKGTYEGEIRRTPGRPVHRP